MKDDKAGFFSLLLSGGTGHADGPIRVEQAAPASSSLRCYCPRGSVSWSRWFLTRGTTL